MDISKELREYREGKRYPQKMLYTYLGVSQQVYSNIENGKNKRLDPDLYNRILYLTKNDVELTENKTSGEYEVIALPAITAAKAIETGNERVILKGHSKEEHQQMIAGLSRSHEGDTLATWIKGKYQISKFAEEYLGMTYANLKHHLAKETIEPGFKRLFEEKMKLDIHRDIFGYPSGGAKPDDAHIREKVRTLNINDMLIELYKEIESLKNKL